MTEGRGAEISFGEDINFGAGIATSEFYVRFCAACAKGLFVTKSELPVVIVSEFESCRQPSLAGGAISGAALFKCTLDMQPIDLEFPLFIGSENVDCFVLFLPS